MVLNAALIAQIASLLGQGAFKFAGAKKAQKTAARNAAVARGEFDIFRNLLKDQKFGVTQEAYDVSEQYGILGEELSQSARDTAQRQEAGVASAMRSGDPRMINALMKSMGQIADTQAQGEKTAAGMKLKGADTLSKLIQRISEKNKTQDINFISNELEGSRAAFDAATYAEEANRQAALDAIGGTIGGLGSVVSPHLPGYIAPSSGQ